MTTRYEKQAKEWDEVKDELLEKADPEAGSVSAHEVTTELRKRLLARGDHLMTMDEILEDLGGPDSPLRKTRTAMTLLFVGPATVSIGESAADKLMEDHTAERIAVWLVSRADWYANFSTFEGARDQADALRDAARKVRSGAWRGTTPATTVPLGPEDGP